MTPASGPSTCAPGRVFPRKSGFSWTSSSQPIPSRATKDLGAAFISDTLAVSAPPDERLYFYRIDSPDVERQHQPVL